MSCLVEVQTGALVLVMVVVDAARVVVIVVTAPWVTVDVWVMAAN